MKFITEEDLRDLYRKEPFTEYVIEPGTRITPGARQFLADRQIFLPDEEPVLTGRSISKQASKPGKPAEEKQICGKRLGARMKSVETLFLLMQMDIEEAFEDCVDNKQWEEVAGKVNQIINKLSQMICNTAGGETCQRED